MPNVPVARERATSRRALLQGATALALPVPLATAAPDPALRVAQQWCALHIEQRRLCLAWQDVESWLFDHRDWPKLSPAEQAALPEADAMRRIEAQLDQIDRTYDTLQPQLVRTAATTRAGLFARLEALLWFLDAEDHPDARALLISCQRDLRRLWPGRRDGQ